MSRLAKKPIAVPAGVTLTLEGDVVIVKGVKGEERVKILSGVKVSPENERCMVTGEGGGIQVRANVGTTWSLIQNAILGVTEGFSKVLEIEGVGYRASMEGETLVLALGYVNPVKVPPTLGIKISTEKSTITVSGINKELVGRIAAHIRSLKKPEPYKGKGIHYRGEVIQRKVGKKAAAAAA